LCCFSARAFFWGLGAGLEEGRFLFFFFSFREHGILGGEGSKKERWKHGIDRGKRKYGLDVAGMGIRVGISGSVSGTAPWRQGWCKYCIQEVTKVKELGCVSS